jgi:hypothetical protein
MPPRGVSPKRKRQYEHIKRSLRSRGRDEGSAKRIAAATTQRTRTAKGETKRRTTSAARGRARRGMAAAGRKGGRARKTGRTRRSASSRTGGRR